MKTNIKLPVNLDKEDWKIIQLAGILLLGLLIFLLFIYLPGRARLNQQKSEMKDLEAQITAITDKAGRGNLAEAALRLRQDLAGFEKHFPSQAEIVLRDISQGAGSAGVSVRGINPATSVPLDKIGGQGMSVAGYDLKVLEVNLNLAGSFYALGDFFQSLKQLSGSPVVRSLRLRRSGSGVDLLEVDARLNAFLLSPRETVK